jgi:TorA maturation chaperone TorD
LNAHAFDILSSVSGQRSSVYRWLATGFYPPEELLAEALRDGSMKRELLDATLWLGKDQQPFLAPLEALDAHRNIDLAILNDSYEILFGKSINRVVGHEAAYSWRSVSHPAQVEEDVNRALINLYGQFGLKPEPEMSEDSLPMELEFMAYMCQMESRRWDISSPKSARELRRQERAFLIDHLGRWLPEFCQRVEELGNNSFYSTLSALSCHWIKLEYGSGYASH